MRAISLPPVRYDATAQRPAWGDLPVPVRDAIEERLGGPVVAVAPAGAGFTRGFAAVVTVGAGSAASAGNAASAGSATGACSVAGTGTGAGGRAFVKATDIDYLVDEYRREAMVGTALPAGVPMARPRWAAAVGDWYLLCLDAIDGHVPALPWRPEELHMVLSTWAVTAELLSGAGDELDLWDFTDVARAELTAWREIHAHRAPLPAMPRYARAHLGELADLERALLDRTCGYPGLMHGDLRLDNVLVATEGDRAWLCDWNHACRGPAWFDTVTLLVTAYASGFDADALYTRHPTTREAPADALDVTLAAISGFWLSHADRRSDASRSIAGHQRWSGEVALGWLAERRGWPLDPPVRTW